MNRDVNPPPAAAGKPPSSTQQQRWMRMGMKLILGTAACGVILFLSTWLMDFVPDMRWRALVALLPMLAVALFVWLFIGLIRAFDERIRRTELLAVCIAAIVTPSLWFAAGLLHAAGVLDVPVDKALFLVLPGMFLAYGAAKIVLMWREPWGQE